MISHPKELAPGEHLCDTCQGQGTYDERLGGYAFSNPEAKCPDCDGKGCWGTAVSLRGDRNQCAGCGELFNSSRAFDKHRAGEHADNQRFCLSPTSMLTKGMSKNAAGYWITKAMPSELHDGSEP